MSKSKVDRTWLSQVDETAINFTKPEIMAKFVATIDEEGYPHLSFITSNTIIAPTQLKWGEFTKGHSKDYVQVRPKQGILYMTAEPPFRFLQIKALLDRISLEGKDAEDFNRMHLFRYNTYMRIYRVFFNNIIHARPIRDIPLLEIVKGTVSMIGNKVGRTGIFESRLSKLGQRLYTGPLFPKFISYLDNDGFPLIIPCFQARAIEGKRIVFSLAQFKEDLLQIPKGAKVSMLALDFETVTQMVKGIFIGFKNRFGIVEIERVYNSMPPKTGYIYPKLEVHSKITQFE